MAFVRWNETTQIWERSTDPTNPSALWNHLPIANPSQALDIANKAYVDAAVAGVNLSGYMPLAGGVFTGKVDFTGGSGTGYHQAPLEVRYANHPRVSFHWPGIVASQIGMDSSGIIRTYNNPGTGYEQFAASHITAYGDINAIAGFLKARDYLQTGGVVYPGRVDIAAPAPQLSYYLGSHFSYGLYVNTGMYFSAAIYGPVYGLMDPNYLTRETTLTDFTPDTGGSFTNTGVYNCTYMRHNGVLFVNIMMNANIPNVIAWYFRIPGGFTAQRYACAQAVVNQGPYGQAIRLEVTAGDVWIYARHANYTVPINGDIFFAGQIQIHVG